MGAQPSVFPHSTSCKDFKVGEALHSGRFPPMRQEGGVDAFSLDRGSLLQLLQSFDIQRRSEKLREAQERRERKTAEREERGRGGGTREKCRSCTRRLCDAHVMRKDALYFTRETDSLVSELHRIFDEGARRALANFLSFSSAKLSTQEMQEASPYPEKPIWNLHEKCSGCKATEKERDDAHAAACVACYKLEGVCSFVEAHGERIRAAAALYAAQTRPSCTSPAARVHRQPTATATSSGICFSPRHRAASLCGSHPHTSSSYSNISISKNTNSTSNREGPRARKADTETMVSANAKEATRTSAANKPTSHQHRRSMATAAAAPQQPLTAALLVLAAPFAQCRSAGGGPPPLTRHPPLPPLSVSPTSPVSAAAVRSWNRGAFVSIKDTVRAPPSAAVSSVIIPRLPSSPSGHS